MVSPKIRVHLSGTVFQTPDFLPFRFGVSIVETCYRLSSTKMDAQSVINWTVVGQLVDNADSELRQFIIVIIKLHLQHDSVVSISDS